MEKWQSFVGLFAMMLIAWAFSKHKKIMHWRIVIGGLVLQFVLALAILKTDQGKQFFDWSNYFVNRVIDLSDQGAAFLFGNGFQEHFFAFKVLPTIIFVSSLSALLFYWGVLQKIVEWMAWVMYKCMGASGSESLVTAANVFYGQTEAPLLIRPYIKTMTRSEINTMMVSGMSTVAGGVLAAYVGMGISAGHLLACSFMAAPATILIAKLMLPETEDSPTLGHVRVKLENPDVNAFDAACRGASEGLSLALNVAAMLIAFIALVALFNGIISVITTKLGFPTNLQEIFGYLFSPFAFLMGVPWEDCLKIGTLLGEKTVLNEFIAYQHLHDMMQQGVLKERSVIIATYALCGFSNFSSVAIQIGGIGQLEPSRKRDFAELGLFSLVGGSLATFMTACVAGILI